MNPVDKGQETSQELPKIEETANAINCRVFSNSMDRLNRLFKEAPPKLQSYTPTHATATELVTHMEMDPRLSRLSNEKKQRIVDACVKGYQESVAILENILGSLAADHPDSHAVAFEMARRISKIAKAYYEILTESHMGIQRELKIRLGSAAEFATYADGTGPGSVGFNPIAIEKVMKDGNLRELMMLVYASLWTALPKIFQDPVMVDKINERLEDFQLNVAALNDSRALSTSDNPVVTFFAESQPLAEFRKAGGRISDPSRPKEPAPSVHEVPDLSIREARATVGTYISKAEFEAMRRGAKVHRVQWVRGRDIFRIDEKSDFYKRAVALGSLPICTGPSGTLDGYMHGLTYLNMLPFKQKLILAMSGWMIRSGDHSYHEIRVAASWHGCPYAPGPQTFESLYPEDPTFQSRVKEAMTKEGKELPGYYLSQDHQCNVARELGYLEKEELG